MIGMLLVTGRDGSPVDRGPLGAGPLPSSGPRDSGGREDVAPVSVGGGAAPA